LSALFQLNDYIKLMNKTFRQIFTFVIISVSACFFTSAILQTTSAQTESTEPAAQGAPTSASATQQPSAPQSLVLSIQYGKGGSIQEYNINSGETIFVPTGTPANPNVQAMNPQEVKETEAYQQQLSQVSDQIAGKITQIQKKQFQIDNEPYLVYRSPEGIEKQALERDLRDLEQRRDQLNSQRTAKEALKPVQPAPPPPPAVAAGITVTPTIESNTVILRLQSQDKKRSSTVKAPLNEWVIIFAGEKGKGLDIWAKVGPPQR